MPEQTDKNEDKQEKWPAYDIRDTRNYADERGKKLPEPKTEDEDKLAAAYINLSAEHLKEAGEDMYDAIVNGEDPFFQVVNDALKDSKKNRENVDYEAFEKMAEERGFVRREEFDAYQKYLDDREAAIEKREKEVYAEEDKQRNAKKDAEQSQKDYSDAYDQLADTLEESEEHWPEQKIVKVDFHYGTKDNPFYAEGDYAKGAEKERDLWMVCGDALSVADAKLKQAIEKGLDITFEDITLKRADREITRRAVLNYVWPIEAAHKAGKELTEKLKKAAGTQPFEAHFEDEAGPALEVGTRVVYNYSGSDMGKNLTGKTGKIIGFTEDGRATVEFDDDIDGHDAHLSDVKGKPGHCWYTPKHFLQTLPTAEPAGVRTYQGHDLDLLFGGPKLSEEQAEKGMRNVLGDKYDNGIMITTELELDEGNKSNFHIFEVVKSVKVPAGSDAEAEINRFLAEKEAAKVAENAVNDDTVKAQGGHYDGLTDQVVTPESTKKASTTFFGRLAYRMTPELRPGETRGQYLKRKLGIRKTDEGPVYGIRPVPRQPVEMISLEDPEPTPEPEQWGVYGGNNKEFVERHDYVSDEENNQSDPAAALIVANNDFNRSVSELKENSSHVNLESEIDSILAGLENENKTWPEVEDSPFTEESVSEEQKNEAATSEKIMPKAIARCVACGEKIPMYTRNRPLRLECPNCGRSGTLGMPHGEAKADKASNSTGADDGCEDKV